jgi:hypothetical protein
MKTDLKEIKASVKTSQEMMKVIINSIWSELKDTIKIQVEGTLSSVDQWIHCLCKAMNTKIEET